MFRKASHSVTAIRPHQVPGRLPLIHTDPFDRMLVAQARRENLTLVTREPRCQQYEVAVQTYAARSA
jgi:PIN domain nuclease of toxin-antitoxin system